MKQLHLKISGQVQGVGFRQSTVMEAKRLGLTGWVRNLADGRVEVLAGGQEADLKKLLEWSHRGPPVAQVEHVETEWQDGTNEYEDFTIV